MPRLVPIILAFALFMENMDATVIATSLAAIAADIGTEPIALKLALTSYLVSLAIFIPVSSWTADRFGARNVFRWSIVVFIIGSIACAFADSLLTFVLARFLQGMGGAMMTPIARLVLVRATPRNELVNAMAWLTIPALIGPIFGPPFGGFLTTFFSWHWIFFINVPIGLIGIWLTTKYLPEFKRNAPRRIDFTGFFLAGTAFAGVVFGTSVITLPALPVWTGIVAIALGVLSGAIYVCHALRTEHPLLDLRLLRFPNFRSTIVGGTFFRLGIGATPFLLPLMLQVSFGLSPFESGMVTFVSAIGAMAAKFTAEWVIERFGFRLTLVVSTGFTALGVLIMGFYFPATPPALFIAMLVAWGFFQSTYWTTQSVFAFADIEDKDTGQANQMSVVWAQVCLALGVALGAAALEGSHLLRGGGAEPALADFHVAFYVMAAIAAISTLVFLRVPRHAGDHISGRGVEKPAE